MNDKDPPPFGYTFTNDFFDNPPSQYDNNGQSILSDMENQQLDNFFSLTNPFDSLDSHQLPPALDAKASAHDYNNWEDFIAPPTVHRVTSTIPDQARPQNSFHQDQQYRHANFLGNTEDELQAATALFNQAQPSYANGRSHSFHDLPSTSNTFPTNPVHDLNAGTLPLGPQHGLLHERLGALVPNHSTPAMDAHFAPQWSSSKALQQHQAEFGPPLQKLDLKRSYAFGTDNSFGSPSGYSGPNGHPSEESAARASIQDLEETSHHILRAVAGIQGPNTTPTAYKLGQRGGGDDDDERSDEATSEDESSDRPAKKRKKSQARNSNVTPKKAVRNGKALKMATMADDTSSNNNTNNKKKRAPATTTQKTHRENLTEEQKRNNHILSEQKRRDLIKQGYKDLNEVVPAVRGGGLSKSQILVEAANFLEGLIEANERYRGVIG
ncbi:hypothetical protein AA0119_g9710 [Alternaria tenuissima]|uniref:BHLH domain-containing protein n=1 Tax=Alternaria tenuissima TaxID=119927 RepID=A0AB37W182_9PLEO|nr:hypothetical protein AA0115_g12416 [Alternaria tenuissima]RYN93268.1 hypothetical protein AA0119_g9710 [Alternaria tenuissima]RYO04825.1 hypothetical protein AA0121_g12652 [Alternaria tenuissima]